MEKTVVLIKPDAIQRSLVGEIIHRFERKGLRLVGLKMMRLNERLLDEHYAHHKDKEFFVQLKEFMQSSPIVAMVWEGIEVISVVRRLIGPTQSREAPAGTIRGDYSMSTTCNIIHASDSVKTAKKELERFFKKEEVFDHEKDELQHVYSAEEPNR